MPDFEITLNCSDTVSYYQVQNGISPVKRLYIKNTSDTDYRDVTVEISSSPGFLLEAREKLETFPSKANLRFDGTGSLSPLFMVNLDRKTEGEISVKIIAEDKVLAETKETVTLLAFDECNPDKPESVATFVRRTPDVNRLVNLAHKKVQEWGFRDATGGYGGSSKNRVRNFFFLF